MVVVNIVEVTYKVIANVISIMREISVIMKEISAIQILATITTVLTKMEDTPAVVSAVIKALTAR